jgi:hypothetical protein
VGLNIANGRRDRLTSPEKYLGRAPEMADRVLALSRRQEFGQFTCVCVVGEHASRITGSIRGRVQGILLKSSGPQITPASLL